MCTQHSEQLQVSDRHTPCAMDLVDIVCHHVTASHSTDPAVCLFTRPVWTQHRHQCHQTHCGWTS